MILDGSNFTIDGNPVGFGEITSILGGNCYNEPYRRIIGTLANDDAANKIDTYRPSILAKKHDIPYCIAALPNTFDLNIKNGDETLLEEKPASEIWSKNRIVPKGIGICNPVFDVANSEDITAVITEKGVVERPNRKE